jgi:hypothetical protein
MRVNTLGSAGARSNSASTVQPLIGWRAFFRIQTTSNAVHAAGPQRGFHGPRSRGAPARLGRTVQDNGVAAAGLGNEADLVDPFDRSFQSRPSIDIRKSGSPRRRGQRGPCTVMPLALCGAI